MSSQLCKSDKTQQNVECDSGFVSCASSLCDRCSMKVAHLSQINDHVKDLQADFAGINDFDAVPMSGSSCTLAPTRLNINNWTGSENCSEVQQQQQQQEQQVPLYKQILQYFIQNDDGDTQLHISVYMEYTGIALWLIDSAPHPSLLDIKNDDCLTALHVAAMTKQAKIIRRLVLAGADPRITTSRLYQPCTSHGNAAIHMACEADDCESVRALTEPLTDEEEEWLSCNYRMTPILGRDLELRNYDGITPMHTAIRKGNLDIVKQLVKVGAKVNTVDPRSGFTSLHVAINNKKRDIVEYMAKEHKSCLNVPTRYGASSYEICLNVDQQLAKDLVQWGAAPIVRESDSDSYSESDSEESVDDESDNYPSAFETSYPNVHQGSVSTATLITT